MSIEAINACIQEKLNKSGMDKVKAIDAAKWLDEAGILKDDPKKPGRHLRVLLKDDIQGAAKEKNLWYINLVKKEPEESVGLVDKVSFDSLDDCYATLSDKKAVKKMLSGDPLSLIVGIRDLVRVSLMDIAINNIKEYDKTANMTDTISNLYSERLIGKVTVQGLHIIRKLGNLASYERDNFFEESSEHVAEIVCRSYLIFYDEAKKNKII